MKQTISIFLILVGLLAISAEPLQAVDPIVTNIIASQRVGSTTVDIYYDLYDADSATTTVMVAVSTNNGVTFDVPATQFSGYGYGYGVMPGTNLHILWEAGADIPGVYMPQIRVQLAANDDVVPEDMVLIPAGTFDMGDPFNYISELPLHTVYVSTFFMDTYEITKEKWDEVYSWAIANSYSFDNAGSGKATNHPVQTINWYDCIKWCNARSEKEGRIPCYYTDSLHTNVYKTGQINVSNNWVNWEANGYRLPTEAEWEKAARGGAAGHRFPWSDTDTITHSRANYYSSTDYNYDVSPTRGYHPDYSTGTGPYTSPVGSFAPNGYGLYDMAGNVFERCWDWSDWSYYSNSPGSDPRGPASGVYRRYRGGSWAYNAFHTNCAYPIESPPGNNDPYTGFRCVCL